MTTDWILGTFVSIGGTSVILIFFFRQIMKPVDAYLETKAKNIATHEDIQKLIDQVRETEQVKTEIADRIWDRQTRWQFKKDTYVALIEALSKLIVAETQWRVKRDEVPATNPAAPEDYIIHWKNLERLSAVAPLAVSQEALASILDSKYLYKDHKVASPERLTHLVSKLMELQQAAKKDLGYT